MRLDFREGGTLPPALLRRLDHLAESQRDAFSALIAGLTQGRERDIDWWVCLPASRNTHASKLFTQCMRLALVRALLDEGAQIEVETDSPAMAAVLRPVLGKAVTLRGGAWKRRLRGAAWNIASSLFHAAAARLAAGRTRAGRRPPGPEPIALLESFVYRDSFSGGRFKDFHYPALYESLDETQRRRFYYLPLFYRLRDYTSFFREMRRSERNFLPREDYLRLSDYAFAFGHWWRAGRLRGRAAPFAGFDAGPLVDADLADGRFANSAVQALLSYRFWSKARSGLAINCYVDWYEGQDLDHAVAAAFNWHADMPRLVSMRPIAPESYLSLTPAPHEVAWGVVARVWGVIGGRVRDEIARAYPALHVLPAPGLRHLRLRDFRRRPAGGGERPVILILLSQEMDLVVQLLAVAGPLLRTDTEYRWRVKRHPGMPKEEAQAVVSSWAQGIELAEGDLDQWLAQAAVVVGLGSNTLLEAAAVGIPVICASGGNEPTEMPFSASFRSGWWSMCYDGSELAALLPEAIAATPATPVSQDLADALLGPFDAAAMQALLFAPLPAEAAQ
jgi:hypothetical protein